VSVVRVSGNSSMLRCLPGVVYSQFFVFRCHRSEYATDNIRIQVRTDNNNDAQSARRAT
jgi:hypothetical protein